MTLCPVVSWFPIPLASAVGSMLPNLHLDFIGCNDAGRIARREKVGGGNEGAKNAGDCREEAKYILHAIKRVVHGGQEGGGTQPREALVGDVIAVSSRRQNFRFNWRAEAWGEEW